jgi:hypothetical protein
MLGNKLHILVALIPQIFEHHTPVAIAMKFLNVGRRPKRNKLSLIIAARFHEGSRIFFIIIPGSGPVNRVIKS